MHISYIQRERDKEEAQTEIIRLLSMLNEWENKKKSEPILLRLKVSITGILNRIHTPNTGIRMSEIRKNYGFALEEFCKNFKKASECLDEGDLANVKEFFKIYV